MLMTGNQRFDDLRERRPAACEEVRKQNSGALKATNQRIIRLKIKSSLLTALPSPGGLRLPLGRTEEGDVSIHPVLLSMFKEAAEPWVGDPGANLLSDMSLY